MDAVLHFWERHYSFSKIKEVEYSVTVHRTHIV